MDFLVTAVAFSGEVVWDSSDALLFEIINPALDILVPPNIPLWTIVALLSLIAISEVVIFGASDKNFLPTIVFTGSFARVRIVNSSCFKLVICDVLCDGNMWW